jgi:hypothetical protein
MNYVGTIIEESLENTDVLNGVKISKTKIEKVTARHSTPWIKQWTVHSVEIPDNQAKGVAEQISKVLDSKHSWYADFKSEAKHYIIFRGRVFFIDRQSQGQYDAARQYGISVGIPEYQVNFRVENF